MGMISWIVIGLIAGYLANKFTGARRGLITSLVIGLVGSFVGGYLATVFRLNISGGWLDQIIVATVGAVLVLFIYRQIRR